MPSPILLPVIALILWTLIMCGWLYATRIPAMSKFNVVYDPSRPAQDFHAQLPAQARWKADNYNNLLEQPTIFYALCLTLALANSGGGLNLWLAWLYVALRVAHSIVHATINKVLLRFSLFAAASIVMAVMSIRAAATLLLS